MTVFLTPDELEVLIRIPEGDLVDLAIELDIPVGESIELPVLLGHIVGRLSDLARREGLPLSAYDVDDLSLLDPQHLGALARVLGASADPQAMVRQGEKVYRRYRRNRPRSQVPLLLPLLLAPLARHLHEGAAG